MFVSHDMYSVERFCDRAMLMERGSMVQIGEPRAIGRAYHKLNFGQLPHEAPAEEHCRLAAPTIADAWFESASGERVTQSQPGGRC